MDILIPKGTIVMWSGSEIPEGWIICDGNNGTPNLIGKFIKASESAGITGGNNTITLSVDNLPNHTHEISELITSDNGSNEHKHIIDKQTLTTSSIRDINNTIEWKVAPEDKKDLEDFTTAVGTSFLSLPAETKYLAVTSVDTFTFIPSIDTHTS